MAGKKSAGAIPQNPKIGQLYYDYPTGTMRKWDGKYWADADQPTKKGDAYGDPE